MAPNIPTIKRPDVLAKGKHLDIPKKNYASVAWKNNEGLRQDLQIPDHISNTKIKCASFADARNGKVNVELEEWKPLITLLFTQRINLEP
jgi:hypothetical protein